MICGQPFIKSMGAMSPVRNLDSQFRGNRKGAPIKEFMMQGAQGDAVFLHIRPARLVPFDVGGFQSHKCIAHAHVKSANRTLILIGPHDPVAEMRIPFPFFRCFEFQVQSHSLKDVFMDRGGEIGFQDGCSDFSGGFRIGGHQIEYVFCESATDILSHQIASSGITAADYPDIFRVLEFPYAVVLKPPERVFRVISFSGRSEINEELLELFIDFSIGDESVSISKGAGQGIKQEKGFMGSALSTSLPDGDAFNEGFQSLFVHLIQWLTLLNLINIRKSAPVTSKQLFIRD